MTATPSETHEAALSDERLRGIIAHSKMVGPNGTPSITTGELSALATELLARRTQPSAGEAVADAKPVSFGYTNWRGERSIRICYPRSVWFGATEWHPEPQWLLRAWDVEKAAERDFAIKDISSAPATPPDQSRVERLEADMERIRLLCESEDGNQTEAVYEIVCQALHGARS